MAAAVKGEDMDRARLEAAGELTVEPARTPSGPTAYVTKLLEASSLRE
jgi:hypothetical protein